MARQKLKNHSGASKRFRRSGSGKLMRRQAGMRHILTSKHPRRKRRLSGPLEVSAVDQASINRILPYR